MNFDVQHPWRGIRKFERHSLVLFVAGTIYVLIGISYFLSDIPPARQEALHYASYVMNLNAWGLVWILVGVLAVISSRWPPISETWGYQALTGQSVAWSAFYLFGVVLHDTPTTNLAGFLTWGLLGFLWWAISGLINPNNLLRLRRHIRTLQAENLKLHEQLVACLEEKE